MSSPRGRIPGTDSRPHALVADADPARVGAIVLVLGEAGIEAVTAYRGSVAIARAADDPPDIVVIGDRLDDGPATGFLARLSARAGAPVLAIGTALDEQAVAALLDAGADDVIAGALRPVELLARVRVLLRRGRVTPVAKPELLPDGLSLDVGRRVADVLGRPLALTPTEFDLLALMASRAGDVVGHRRLLRAVWPDRPEADADLLRAHLTHLNAKLVAAGHPGLRNVRSVGYGLRVAGGGPAG